MPHVDNDSSGCLAGLHVAIVPSWWPSPESPVAGVFFQDYVRAFADAGAAVGVIYPDLVNLRLAVRRGALPVVTRVLHESVGGSPVVRLRGLSVAFRRPGVHMRRYLRRLRRGFAIYRERYGEPDILHAMCAIPAGWACTRLDGGWSRRVVVTEHTGPFSLALIPQCAGDFTRAALADAAAVVAVGAALRDEMTAAGISREINVIGNPVGNEFVPAPPPAAESDLKGRPKYRGLFVGRLSALKGIPELTAAASTLASDPGFSIEWHVAGTGELESGLRKILDVVGLDVPAVMHGHCGRSEIADLLRCSHFLVLPSHGENCPLSVCEALATGRPVVGTRVPGIAALVGRTDGVLCDVGDAGALAAAIRRLVLDYERYDWQAISSRARASFDGMAVAAAYSKVFTQVVQGSPVKNLV